MKCFVVGCGAALLCSLVCLGHVTDAFACPAQVVIIRHGEKPDQGNEVNSEGCERAFLLPHFFETNPIVEAYGKPAAIFAMEAAKSDSSIRAIQTIAPTALALGLTIDDSHKRTQYTAIVDDIMSDPSLDGKTVLIAWEHNAIPGLAKKFGVKLTADIKSWPSNVFDEAWVIRFTEISKSGKLKNSELTIIPEDVLPTDNSEGGASWGNGPGPSSGSVPVQLVSECETNANLNLIVQNLTDPPIQKKKSKKLK